MSNNPDHIVPEDNWAFSEDVAKCFDDMLERSIPGYTDMRLLSYSIGKTFIHNNSYILDLGASRGGALSPYIEDDIAMRYIGLETSEPMRDEMKNKYRGNRKVSVVNFDLRQLGVEDIHILHQPNLVLSILTLMFTPIQYRPQIIEAVYEMLPEGGAFILVEKVLGASAQIDKLLVDVYHETKLNNGYTLDDINRKKASLEGVQVPLTADFNVEMLKAEGFKKVECFYRNLNFAGWVAIK